MGRRETGFIEDFFNSLFGTGTSVKKTADFWGNPKTIVHHYSTGTTKEYTHNQGFFGNRTDVKVKRNGDVVGRGHIKKDFWGHDVETIERNSGKIRKSVKKMNAGFFGNHDQTTHYDDYGNKIGESNGRQGLIFNTYTKEYTGKCFRCDGTGIYQPTGKTCRKCGGTGIFRKNG